jgi:hypothetical protein
MDFSLPVSHSYYARKIVPLDADGLGWTPIYFPMQKLEKIRFRISSAVVAPVS